MCKTSTDGFRLGFPGCHAKNLMRQGMCSSCLCWGDMQEKRSAYAPPEEQPVRYDGTYRIVKCWRKPGAQNFLMCRYLFVRADNSPAPWSSEGTHKAEGILDPVLNLSVSLDQSCNMIRSNFMHETAYLSSCMLHPMQTPPQWPIWHVSLSCRISQNVYAGHCQWQCCASLA